MHLPFFLSSPGDVSDERTFAQQVIEQELPKDPLLRGQITCEAMRWDDPNAPVTMPATLTPQEAVNRGLAKPSECNVVIVILWSRLGTLLPDTYKKPDGSPYLSECRNGRANPVFATAAHAAILVPMPMLEINIPLNRQTTLRNHRRRTRDLLLPRLLSGQVNL